MIKELASDSQQREVITPRVGEELNCCFINLQSQRLKERNERVYQLFIVEVEFKRDQLVQKWVAQYVVFFLGGFDIAQ